MAQREADWSKAKTVVAITIVCTLAACAGTLLQVPEVREFLGLVRVAQQPSPQSSVPAKQERHARTAHEAYADFTGGTIEASNIRVTPHADFAYNTAFGGSWRITTPGGGFTAELTLPTDGRYDLIVTHLTSLANSCPGHGYSPITIQVNSGMVAENYDPAGNHAGTHAMVTDAWSITAHAGQNTLQWTAGALCTHYWIRRIEVNLAQQLE